MPAHTDRRECRLDSRCHDRGVALTRLKQVVRALVAVGRAWNWKSALCSSVVRSTLFALANVASGPDAAIRAALTELLYRGVVSGFHGTLTQTFSRLESKALGTACALVLLPVLGHSMEWAVHRTVGTPHLMTSLIASAGFSVLSTCFHLYVMRRDVLVVGVPEAATLRDDLRRMPGLVAEFVTAPARMRWR